MAKQRDTIWVGSLTQTQRDELQRMADEYKRENILAGRTGRHMDKLAEEGARMAERHGLDLHRVAPVPPPAQETVEAKARHLRKQIDELMAKRRELMETYRRDVDLNNAWVHECHAQLVHFESLLDGGEEKG